MTTKAKKSYKVSEENIRAVESYIVRRIRETGSRTIAEPFNKIAEGSGVSLVTTTKAMDELARLGAVRVVKSASRRNPNQYTYLLDIEDFIMEEEEMTQLEYLKKQVEELRRRVQELETENRELRLTCSIR